MATTILRAIKVRLYLNKAREERANQLLGCCRLVYNKALDEKKKAYDERKESLGLTQLSKWFHGEFRKNDDYWFVQRENTKVLKQEIRHMLTAYDNHFKRGTGWPKFKSKRSKNSATFPLGAISKRNTFAERKITLTQDLKDLRFRCSNLNFRRLHQYKDGIHSVTLTKAKSGRFYASVLVEMPRGEYAKFAKTEASVGIDLGVKDLVVTSEGERFANEHFFRKTERRIAKLQRQWARKRKGSRNSEKTRLKIARAWERLDNQKEAYLHSVVNSLLSRYDTVYMEDLDVKGMLHNNFLAKAIQEVGMGRFATILASKALASGKEVVKVGRFFPSTKTCSECGFVNKELTLSDREWTCPSCGARHDRDVNAAVNILREGESAVGTRSPELKPVESPTDDGSAHAEPASAEPTEAGSGATVCRNR